MESGMSYAEFLASKARRVGDHGIGTDVSDVHPMLHEWQREIVAWASRKGRAAIWADTGLGKTFMQIEWARLTGNRSLIVAPLAVCQQTVREAAKLDVSARYVRSDADADGPGLWITNYEMIGHFDPSKIDAVVLDEASILKQSDGKTRTRMISHFADVPYRLACTATPAPNDPEELTNQAEFLGVMPRVEMLAAYFVHDQDGWRLKGHAHEPMFRWMATWAIALRKPSDIGYSDDGYILPGLKIIPRYVASPPGLDPEAFLPTMPSGVTGRSRMRQETVQARTAAVAEIVAAEPTEPWVLWCGLNVEAERLAKIIPGAVNVHGSMTPEEKAAELLKFADGETQILITKPKLAAFGMNWQHCARMAFVGLSDSYEAYYQSIRRCYRYGQERVVNAHVVLSDVEGVIATNIARKEREASRITSGLVAAMRRAREEIE